MEKEIIIYHESVLKSWLKDTWTQASFVVVIAINYFFFDNNGVATFLLFMFWFIWKIALAKVDAKFYDKESAINHIKNL